MARIRIEFLEPAPFAPRFTKEESALMSGTRNVTFNDFSSREISQAYTELLKRFGKEPSEADVIWAMLVERRVQPQPYCRNALYMMAVIHLRAGRFAVALRDFVELLLDDLHESPRLEPAPLPVEKVRAIADHYGWDAEDVAANVGISDMEYRQHWPRLVEFVWPD